MSGSRLAVLGGAAVLAAFLVGGLFYLGGSRSPSVVSDVSPASSPISTPSATLPPSVVPTAAQADPPAMPTWVPYTSSRYGFTVSHPSDWTVQPSTRAWTFKDDAKDFLSPAQDAFVSPDGHIRLSVWSVPFGGRDAGPERFEAWIEDFCQTTGSTPCAGIHDRAVALCIERRDCHFSLLVPFDDDVQAFLSGGVYPSDCMTVVAVWRGQGDPTVATYGGSRQLLEAFLSTMSVWPESVPFDDRQVRDVPIPPPS